jgi:hypothetical protein
MLSPYERKSLEGYRDSDKSLNYLAFLVLITFLINLRRLMLGLSV